MGRVASLALCWETGDMRRDAWLLQEKARDARRRLPGRRGQACAGAGLPRPRKGRWSAWEGGCWREEWVQHAHRGAGEGTAPRQHRGRGAYLWGRGWNSRRQDSDRMGQSLGPCLLRLIPVLRPPHRGLLAAACTESGSALVRAGAEPSRGLTPSWEGRGAPAIVVLQLWVRGAPEEGGNTSKHGHPPHSEGTHCGHATSHPHWLRVSER